MISCSIVARRRRSARPPSTASTSPSSAYLPGAAPATRRLEVIGDSISAGYGNEGTYPCQFTSATENQYLSYEALAARALNAELYTEAWSGIGMLHNYDGGTTDVMPDRYPRTLPERATSTWDFARFVPRRGGHQPGHE